MEENKLVVDSSTQEHISGNDANTAHGTASQGTVKAWSQQETAEFLGSVPAWYLATSTDNRPHVRPFSFAAVEEGRIWFVTANNKDVYRELVENPFFELSAWRPGQPWLIIKGRAVFAEPSAGLRLAGFEHMVALGEAHVSPNDGLLVFFYVEEGSARVCDITGAEFAFDV
jgi:uncharacterized pyridoxamine 5'-phosphate oxidase family protein